MTIMESQELEIKKNYVNYYISLKDIRLKASFAEILKEMFDSLRLIEKLIKFVEFYQK